MIEAILRQLPLFASLPTAEIEQLAEIMKITGYPPGQVLFKEGEPGDRFSILLEGRVEVLKDLGTPDERLLSVVNEGDFLGEMSLLDRQGRRTASARAQTSVRLIELERAGFDDLLERQPSVAIGILRKVIVRARNSESATIRDLQEKNRRLLQAYQELQEAQKQLVEKEKMDHELNMARRIQESLLPKDLPSMAGWELAAHWQPARAVSGDFYDFLQLPGGRLGVLVGDVTDKGVPAALIMAITRSVLRTVAAQGALPTQVLSIANDLLLAEMPPNMFVTCLYALLDMPEGRLRFANAGHCLPFHLSGGQVSELRATGMPLGLMPGMSYEEKEIVLQPGEGIVLYSDGLIEAHNAQGEMFSSSRLRERLRESESGHGLIRRLLEGLADFTGPQWEQEDDVTVLTLYRQGEG